MKQRDKAKLPFTVPFQRQVVKYLLTNTAFWSAFRRVIKPSHFTTEVHRYIIKRVLKHHETTGDQKPVGLRFVEQFGRLQPKKAQDSILTEWKELQKLPDKTSVAATAAVMRDFIFEQELRVSIIQAAELIEKKDVIAAKDVIDRVYDQRQVSEDLGLRYFDDVRRSESFRDCVPTLWPTMNHIMGGGNGTGEVGLVMMPIKSGKSWTLAHLGLGGLISRKTVVIYTLEMRDRIYAHRIDRIVFGEELNRGKNHLRSELQDAREMLKAELFIKQYPNKRATVDTLESHLSAVEDATGKPIGLVIIDYADLLAPQKHYGERRHEIEDIYNGIRALAVERDVPIWTASQVNKGSWDKDIVDSSDIAEDSRKLAIVDFAVSAPKPRKKIEAGDVMKLFVADSRNEMSRVFIPLVWGNHMRLRERPQEDKNYDA